MRQKTELEITLQTVATGEARSCGMEGTEARTAKTKVESQAAGGPSMEAIFERDNLRRALAHVKRNKGAAGIDGMSLDALAPHLKEHWPAIRAQLLEGSYKPQPVRRWRYQRHRVAHGRSAFRHGLHNAPCSTRVWRREAMRGELATQSRSL